MSDIFDGTEHAPSTLIEEVEKYCDVLDRIAQLKAKLVEQKARLKADGWEMKQFAQVVKETMGGVDYQCAQLEGEAKLTAYRSGAGLPTTVEDAQRLVRGDIAIEPAVKIAKAKAKKPAAKARKLEPVN